MDTIDTTDPVGKKGLSRRQVIVGGAVGTAAFWSVPIIDSVTQRAAATSGCQGNQVYTVSYVFVVYTFGGTTYFTGYTVGCADQGANKISETAGPCSNGVTYSMTSDSVAVNFSPPANSSATQLSVSGASPYITCDKNTGKILPAQTGVVIVAYFWFTGNGNGGPGAECGQTSTGNPVCVTFG